MLALALIMAGNGVDVAVCLDVVYPGDGVPEGVFADAGFEFQKESGASRIVAFQVAVVGITVYAGFKLNYDCGVAAWVVELWCAGFFVGAGSLP